MNIVCEKTLLSNAIDGVSRAVTLRSSISALEGIHMVADGFSLTLTCYNLELAITITIEANVRTPGECVLNAKLLGDMVRRMPSGEVELALNDNGTVEIRGGTAKFELTALNLNDFPTLPNPGATPTLTLKASELHEMINKTIYAVSQDDKKPAHTGELFVIEPDETTVVAVDGYRLAILKQGGKGHPDHHSLQDPHRGQQADRRRGRGSADQCQSSIRRFFHRQRLHHSQPPHRGRISELRKGPAGRLQNQRPH